MNIFECDDYKQLTLQWIQEQPGRGQPGRGQLQKIAQCLNVGSTFVSQVFRGDRELSPGEALRLCEHFRFSQLERDYFVLLVQKARAGTKEFTDCINEKLRGIRRRSETLEQRIDVDKELSEVQNARFYSSWHYAAVRNLLALPGPHAPDKIARRLNLEPEMIKEALDFLLESGLCVRNEGHIEPGPQFTHLSANSPLVKARQIQWRLKAFEAMNRPTTQKLFYTCPMSLSLDVKNQIRTMLLQTIQDALQLVKDSPSEELACLNVDWFSF